MSLDVTLLQGEEVVYTANITHNLNKMAGDCLLLYEALWRPEELNCTHAKHLIDELEADLVILKSDPERFKKLNPANGWGTYEGLVEFVEKYLEACKQNPDAEIHISR